MGRDEPSIESAVSRIATESIDELHTYRLAYRRFRSFLLILCALTVVVAAHLLLRLYAGVRSSYDATSLGLLVSALLLLGVGVVRCLGMVTAQATERFERMAFCDDLTGAYNLHYIRHRLKEEVARARRAVLPLSVVYVDLDHFKEVNDQHGHREGNRVLQRVVAVLQSSVREVDLVGRLGGDEFILVLPGTSTEGGAVVAQRCLETLSATDRDSVGSDSLRGVTLSAGVAEYVPHGRKYVYDDSDMAIGDLISEAERAMYRAKKEGGGRLAVHQPHAPTATTVLATSS